MLFFWCISITVTCIVAAQKNRNIAGWFLLGLILGPIALILAILSKRIEDRKEKIDYQYSETPLS